MSAEHDFLALTARNLDIKPTFCIWHLDTQLIEWISLCFNWNLIDVCFWESHWQWVSAGSGNDMILNRRYLITWTNETTFTGVHMHHPRPISWWHHQMETFPRYWPFVRGIRRSPVNFPHKGQWRGALIFSLICAWINGWINNREAGDLRRHRVYYDVILMT